MSVSRRGALATLAAFAGSPALGEAPRLDGYAGPDAGQLILSIAAQDRAQHYRLRLLFRRKGETAQDRLEFDPSGLFLFVKHDFGDFNEDEGLFEGAIVRAIGAAHTAVLGVVTVTALQPGQYEIFNLEESALVGSNLRVYRLASDVSIGFEIIAGQATYLGEFKAVPIMAKNVFGISLPDGAEFVITDQSARDIPIAEKKANVLGEPRTVQIAQDALAGPLKAALY